MTTKPTKIGKYTDLCTSWIGGKYENGEINTAFSHVIVKDPEFFAQGEEAENIIKEVHQIWILERVTQEEAFKRWIDRFLNYYGDLS